MSANKKFRVFSGEWSIFFFIIIIILELIPTATTRYIHFVYTLYIVVSTVNFFVFHSIRSLSVRPCATSVQMCCAESLPLDL